MISFPAECKDGLKCILINKVVCNKVCKPEKVCKNVVVNVRDMVIMCTLHILGVLVHIEGHCVEYCVAECGSCGCLGVQQPRPWA